MTVKVPRKPTMSIFILREAQHGRQGEPAITRKQKHFSKIHESNCKPRLCLACSYLGWRVEVIADLCGQNEWMNERQSKYLNPRVWAESKLVLVYFTITSKEPPAVETICTIANSQCNCMQLELQTICTTHRQVWRQPWIIMAHRQDSSSRFATV